MCKVSVIVPVYNAAPYLSRCIESLIQQTHNNLQIILINDGSTDNSLAICETFAQQDQRIEVYSQDNQGQGAARNRGLEHATGEYVSFIDADDYIDRDFCSTMLEAIESDADCVQIGYRRVLPNGDITEQHTPCHFYQYTSPCMRLYRLDFIKKNTLRFPEGMIYEDVVFSVDLWCIRPRYKTLQYRGYNYVMNTASTTSSVNLPAQKKLFRVLQQKWKQHTTFRNRSIIAYTMLRLKIHFAL